ncbi:MAG: hypothetical protein WDN46_23090 [Methylocella sp.]
MVRLLAIEIIFMRGNMRVVLHLRAKGIDLCEIGGLGIFGGG